VPFYAAHVQLVTVLKLDQDKQTRRYLIQSQEDLYQTNEFVKFFWFGGVRLASDMTFRGKADTSLVHICLAVADDGDGLMHSRQHNGMAANLGRGANKERPDASRRQGGLNLADTLSSWLIRANRLPFSPTGFATRGKRTYRGYPLTADPMNLPRLPSWTNWLTPDPRKKLHMHLADGEMCFSVQPSDTSLVRMARYPRVPP
jgi:hypothetical protein